MVHAFEGIQPTSVPMTPDRTVEWQRSEIPSMQGTLYYAAEGPIAEQTLAVAANQSGAFENPRILDMNDSRAVVADGEVVYKTAWRCSMDQIMGLSAVRANVAMHTGFQRAPRPDDDDPMVGPHYYTAPEMHAVFVPDAPTFNRQVIAMAREHGETPENILVPYRATRITHYAKAVAACGLVHHLVNFDDYVQNMLVRRDDAGTLRIAKLDVMATIDYRNTTLYQ